MELRGQDKRSIGGLMPSSSSVYNNPFSTTSVISSPTSGGEGGGGGERIRDGTSNNNGVNSSQIQDLHHHHNHHQHRQQPIREHHNHHQHRQQPIREPIDPPPDQDPVPVSIAVVGAPSSPIAGGSTTTLRRTTSNEIKSTTPTIRYRECLKNHAASIGGHVTDGCGEFMPSGEDGTREALKCAACDCHRNFHRKEVDGEPQSGPNCYYCYNPNKVDRGSRVPPPPITATPTLVPAPLQQHQNKFQFGLPSSSPPSGPIQPMMVAFGGGGGGGVTDQSSSEELNVFHSSGTGAGHPPPPSFGGSKKRFRTKFSQEQKDKMLGFAEKIGWRIQKQDEAEVQQFCAEVGVKRQVLKVWMHNNKHAMKKKDLE